jgi:hypothetical protein
MRRAGYALAAALLLAAAPGCERAERPPAAQAPADTAPPGVLAREDTLLLAVVRREGEGSYVLHGRTEAAETLQFSVEDGHYVLFGPAELPVRDDGTFRISFAIDPTEFSTVYAYLVDPGGTGQWVIPIPLDAERVEWGPGSEAFPDPGA